MKKIFLAIAIGLFSILSGIFACTSTDLFNDNNDVEETNNTVEQTDNDKKEEHIHNFSLKVIDEKYKKNDADCDNPAAYYYVCSCGEISSLSYFDGNCLNHNYQFSEIVWNGYTAKAIYVCVNDPKHKEEYDCTITNEVTLAPTCVAEGTKVYTATYDGHTDTKNETLSINSNNHDIVSHEAKAPTCTEVGWDAYDTCSRCEYTTYDEISALNHNYQFSEIVWNGYTAKAIYVCSNNSSHKEEHDCTITNEVTLAPTCVAEGTKVYTATYDGHTDTKNETLDINTDNHDIVHHDEKAPTCTEVGWNSYDTCSRCEYTTYDEISKLNHNYQFSEIVWNEYTAKAIYVCVNDSSHTDEHDCTITNEVTLAPTCVAEGTKVYTATYDGHTDTKNETLSVNSNNHDIVSHDAKAPTCTEVGWDAYDTCSRCEYTTYSEISALNHNYQFSEIVWNGYTAKAIYVCSNNNSHTEEHDCTITNEVTLAPTCVAEGTKVYTATYDGHTDTKNETLSINSNNHDIVSHDAKNPTCTEVGWDAYDTCSRCEYTTYDEISALNHNYQFSEIVWNGYTAKAIYVCANNNSHKEEHNCAITNEVTLVPTCVAEGTKVYTATYDGHTDTKNETLSINSNNHDIVSHDAKNPTCTEVGWNAYDTCSRCSYTTYDEISALNHNYEFSEIVWNGYTAKAIYVCANNNSHTEEHDCTITNEVTLAPTCVAEGTKVYTATYDGHTDTKNETLSINSNNHDIVHHDTKAPTCTEVGWNAYDTCSRCEYTTYSEISALNHNYEWLTDLNATYNSTGLKHQECTRCHDKIDLNTTIDVLTCEHQNISHFDKVETQCESNGTKEYYYCSTCGHYYSDSNCQLVIDSTQFDTWKVISKLNHNYEFSEIVWNGYTAKAIYICSNNNSHKEEYDCTITNEVTLAPTCVAEGTKVYTATYDGHTDTKNETLSINSNNHDTIHHDAKAPTCTEVGWDAYDTCSRCEYTTYSEISALNHNYQFSEIVWNGYTAKAIYVCANNNSHKEEHDCTITNEVTLAPTCIAEGTKVYTATYDGHTDTKNETLSVNSNNHDIVSHDAKNPTCTEVGWDAYDTCSRCEYTTYSEISALNHNYQFSEIVWNGYTAKAVYVCSNNSNHTEEHDCTITNEVTLAPTCVAEGTKVYTATYDGHTDTKNETLSINSNNHDIVHHDAKAPTCTEVGWNAYDTCSRCEYTTYDEISALNHNYQFSEIVWNGYTAKAIYVCSNDSSHTEEHDCTITNEVTLAPTCVAEGTKVYTATYDGHTDTKNETLEINANNHDIVHHDAKAPTCTEVGWDAYDTCSRCEYTTYDEISKLNHNYQFSEIVWNGYTAKAVYVCANNNSHTEEHNCTITNEVTLAPTCVAEGTKVYTATYDGHTDTKNETLSINSNNHDIVHHDAKAPNCTEAGWNDYDTCSRCEYTTYSEISALNHNYQFSEIVWNGYTAKAIYVCANNNSHKEEHNCTITNEVTLAPTCVVEGTKVYTATYDGHTDTKNETLSINSNNHDIVHHDAKAPTCTEVGWNAYDTCSRCSYTTYSEISALNHNYQYSKIVWNGYKAKAVYVCSNNNSHKEEHDCTITNEVTLAPTCIATGTKVYTATYDGHSASKNETLAVNTNNHSLKSKVTSPTETVDGYTTYSCNRCSYSYNGDIVPKTGYVLEILRSNNEALKLTGEYTPTIAGLIVKASINADIYPIDGLTLNALLTLYINNTITTGRIIFIEDTDDLYLEFGGLHLHCKASELNLIKDKIVDCINTVLDINRVDDDAVIDDFDFLDLMGAALQDFSRDTTQENKLSFKFYGWNEISSYDKSTRKLDVSWDLGFFHIYPVTVSEYQTYTIKDDYIEKDDLDGLFDDAIYIAEVIQSKTYSFDVAAKFYDLSGKMANFNNIRFDITGKIKCNSTDPNDIQWYIACEIKSNSTANDDFFVYLYIKGGYAYLSVSQYSNKNNHKYYPLLLKGESDELDKIFETAKNALGIDLSFIQELKNGKPSESRVQDLEGVVYQLDEIFKSINKTSNGFKFVIDPDQLYEYDVQDIVVLAERDYDGVFYKFTGDRIPYSSVKEDYFSLVFTKLNEPAEINVPDSNYIDVSKLNTLLVDVMNTFLHVEKGDVYLNDEIYFDGTVSVTAKIGELDIASYTPSVKVLYMPQASFIYGEISYSSSLLNYYPYKTKIIIDLHNEMIGLERSLEKTKITLKGTQKYYDIETKYMSFEDFDHTLGTQLAFMFDFKPITSSLMTKYIDDEDYVPGSSSSSSGSSSGTVKPSNDRDEDEYGDPIDKTDVGEYLSTYSFSETDSTKTHHIVFNGEPINENLGNIDTYFTFDKESGMLKRLTGNVVYGVTLTVDLNHGKNSESIDYNVYNEIYKNLKK